MIPILPKISLNSSWSPDEPTIGIYNPPGVSSPELQLIYLFQLYCIVFNNSNNNKIEKKKKKKKKCCLGIEH